MKKSLYFIYLRILIILILISIVSIGCQEVSCKRPYIKVGTDCCLDEDYNNVCDSDEVIEDKTEVIITETVTETVTEVVEKEVTKYVCSNGTVVEDPDDCPVVEEYMDEDGIFQSGSFGTPDLVTDNENGSAILEVSVAPACVGGENGGSIYFNVGTVPGNYSIELKEVGSSYEEVFKSSGKYEGYNTFAICDDCRYGEFKLKFDTQYIVRMVFDQTVVYDRIDYSNEHLIDTRSDSAFILKMC